MASASFIQQAYIAFFNRPADKEGFNHWRNYPGPDQDLLNEFAKSAEYLSDFANKDNRKIIEIVYKNLFGRPPEKGGWDYWEAQMNAGWVTVGNAAYEILGGAQGKDLAIVENKTAAAQVFTDSLETKAEIDAYAKAGANGVGNVAKEWLASVNDTYESFEAAMHKGNSVFDTLINANANSAPGIIPGAGEDRNGDGMIQNLYIYGHKSPGSHDTLTLLPEGYLHNSQSIRWDGSFNNGLLTIINFGANSVNTYGEIVYGYGYDTLDFTAYFPPGTSPMNAATLRADGSVSVPVPFSDLDNLDNYNTWVKNWTIGTNETYITFTRPNTSTTVYKIEFWTKKGNILDAYDSSVLTYEEYMARAIKGDPLLTQFTYKFDEKDTAQLIGYLDVGREIDEDFFYNFSGLKYLHHVEGPSNLDNLFHI